MAFITVSNASGNSVSFTKARAQQAINELIDMAHDEGSLSFFLNGKDASRKECIWACELALDAAYAKKCQTHTQVFVRHGVTNQASNFKPVWIRK